MRRLLSVIWCLLLLLVTSSLRAQTGYTYPIVRGEHWVNTDYNTTEGTDFWVTFLASGGNQGVDVNNLQVRVFATARQDADVTIHYTDGTFETFHVAAMNRGWKAIDLNKGYVLTDRVTQSKGIHVTSTTPISLYAVSQNPVAGSQDATNVLPTKALEREYVIQTYANDRWSTEFAIVATQYTPQITIDLQMTFDEEQFPGDVGRYSDTTKTIPIGPLYPGDACSVQDKLNILFQAQKSVLLHQ